MAADGAASVTKPLRFPSLFALGVNGIVGVGIFFAPREVAASVPGWRGLWVYAVVTLLLLPIGLVFARLGRAFPEDGGPYVYAKAAFGSKVAFAVGWTTYLSALFSTATVIVGLVENSSPNEGVTSSGGRLVAELALLTVLTAALSRGLRLSALMWSGVTVLKALPLLALPCVAALAYAGFVDSGLARASVASSSGAAPNAVLGAVFPVLFALQGFEVVPLPAAQVHRPETNVPLATVSALAFAGLLYIGLHASCLAALPDLGDRTFPLAAAADVYGGVAFRRLIATATSLSGFGIVIGMLAMTPRYLAALGGGDALGLGLSEQNPRAVPVRAFVMTYALLFAILCVNAVWGSIGRILALASLSVMLQYAATASALFFLARRGTAGLRPRDLWPAPLALLACGVFALGATPLEIPVVLGMLLLGFAARALGAKRSQARLM